MDLELRLYLKGCTLRKPPQAVNDLFTLTHKLPAVNCERWAPELEAHLFTQQLLIEHYVFWTLT